MKNTKTNSHENGTCATVYISVSEAFLHSEKCGLVLNYTLAVYCNVCVNVQQVFSYP
jgi:hypothetical protein